MKTNPKSKKNNTRKGLKESYPRDTREQTPAQFKKAYEAEMKRYEAQQDEFLRASSEYYEQRTKGGLDV